MGLNNLSFVNGFTECAFTGPSEPVYSLADGFLREIEFLAPLRHGFTGSTKADNPVIPAIVVLFLVASRRPIVEEAGE